MKRAASALIAILLTGLIIPCSGINQPVIDRLRAQLATNEPDTQKSLDYGELARQYKFASQDTALQYATLAYNLAVKHNFIKGQAFALKYTGEIYLEKNNPDTVPSLFYRALELFESISFDLGVAETYYIIGNFNYQQGNLREALELQNKSVNLYLKLEPTRRIHYILNEIGANLYYQGKYEEANSYYSRALAYDLQQRDTYMVASTINNIALSFEKLGQKAEAYQYYKLCYRISKSIGFKDLLPAVLTNIGKMHLTNADTSKAMAAFIKSLSYVDSTNVSYERAETYTLLARLYVDGGNLNLASAYLDSTYSLLQKKPRARLQQEFLEICSSYFEKKGDLRHALECQKELNFLNDSLEKISEVKMSKANELRSELKSRELEIKKLSETNNEQKAEIEQGKLKLLFLIIVALSIMLITVILYINYRSKSQVNKELEELNKERNTLMGMMSHDLKAPLASIQSFSELIEHNEQKLNEEQSIYMQYIRQIVDNSFGMINNVLELSKVYDKNTQVNKVRLNMAELVYELTQNYKFQAAKKGITLVAENLDKVFEPILADPMHIKRITENLISNAIKFSPPDSKIFVSLHCLGDRIELHVKDQGPGISQADQLNLFKKYQRLSAVPTGNESSTGLGLYIVKKLTELNGGKVWCESEVGLGATFKVSFPNN